MSGTGIIKWAEGKSNIVEGSGIFIPAGIQYSFINDSSKPLEVLIITEEIPEGFKPGKKIIIRNYKESKPGFCCWAYTIRNLFGKSDGLAEPMGIAVITVEGLGMGSPHYHIDGCEEIWTKIKGEQNLLMLGKKLLRQDIGDAFLAPPDGLVPHSVINPGESEMCWLYIGNRHDK